MNLKSSRSALIALGIAAAATIGLAPVISSAQTPPQQLPADPNRAAPAPNDRGDPRGFDRRANRFEDRLERRLNFLHSELRITPQQEQVWAIFADAVRREAQAGRDQFFDRRDEFRGGPMEGPMAGMRRRPASSSGSNGASRVSKSVAPITIAC